MKQSFGSIRWLGASLLIIQSCLGRQLLGPGCACTLQYGPVCCDGKEFGNQCAANCVGASNCRSGACGNPAPAPGPVLSCAPGSAVASCIAGLCTNARCPAVPDAKCEINFCSKPLVNGEQVNIPICTEYFVKNGKIVDCDAGDQNKPPLGPYLDCQGSTSLALCIANVCENAKCPAAPGAVCEVPACPNPVFTLTGKKLEGFEPCNPVFIDVDGASVVNDCKGVTGLDAKLIGSWTLVKIKQTQGLLPFPGAEATIVFTNEGNSKGNVGGSNGCNNYGGGYVVPTAGKLEVGVLFSTLKLCEDPDGTLEGLYMPLIQEVDSFKVGPNSLRLFKGKEKVLVFKKDQD